MAYIVAEPCIKCKYTDCVDVCPVSCFYEGQNFLVIHPEECIDCGACEPECPTTAIYEEDGLPEKWAPFIGINAVLSGSSEPDEVSTEGWPAPVAEAIAKPGFSPWPNIPEKKDQLPEADEYAAIEDKVADLSPEGAYE